MARIGVFVCHCGENIGRTVRAGDVAKAAERLPGTVFAADYPYFCSAPGQKILAEAIKDHKLDGVVVAACSPQLHEPTFRAAATHAGLNPLGAAASLTAEKACSERFCEKTRLYTAMRRRQRGAPRANPPPTHPGRNPSSTFLTDRGVGGEALLAPALRPWHGVTVRPLSYHGRLDDTSRPTAGKAFPLGNPARFRHE